MKPDVLKLGRTTQKSAKTADVILCQKNDIKPYAQKNALRIITINRRYGSLQPTGFS